jgi:hypothetical protein
MCWRTIGATRSFAADRNAKPAVSEITEQRVNSKLEVLQGNTCLSCSQTATNPEAAMLIPERDAHEQIPLSDAASTKSLSPMRQRL